MCVMMKVSVKSINKQTRLGLKANSEDSDGPVNTWIRVKVLKSFLVNIFEINNQFVFSFRPTVRS